MKPKRNLAMAFCILVMAFSLFVPYEKMSFAKDQVLKIGSWNPRTGPAASWGLNSDRANDLCAEAWNNKGGVKVRGETYKIEMIHEDDKARGEEGVKALNKLLYSDKVKFIVGPMMSTPFLAAAPIVEASKTVTFVGCMAPAVLKDRKYVFRIAVPWNHSAPAVFDYIKKTRPDLKTTVHISSNDATGWASTQADNDACYAVGIKILASEFYDHGTQDFTSLLGRALPLQPSFLSFAGTPPSICGLIIKQARELGYKGEFIHSSVCSPTQVGPIAGWDNIEGMITGSMTMEGAKVPQAVKDVYARWIDKYGEENAGGFQDGIIQYPAIDILCKGLEKANSFESDKVVSALESMGEISTIYGKARWGGMATYNNNHQLLVPVWITQVKNKKLDVLSLEAPWEVPPPQQKWR